MLLKWEFLNNLFSKIILHPIKNNLPLSLIILGLVLFFVGFHFSSITDLTLTCLSKKESGNNSEQMLKCLSEPSFVDHLKASLSKIGLTILGAGFFAAILKSAQFIEVFQSHILDVFYSPAKIATIDVLRTKWLSLTDVILKNTLPATHCDASKKIMGQFFDDELQYHFEKYEVTYDISVVESKEVTTLNIQHSINTEIIVSPNHNDPIFQQQIKTNEDGSCELKSLIVDDKPLETEDIMTQNKDDPLKKDFILKINELLTRGKDKIKMERVYDISQDLSKEPYIIGTNIRYVKGFVVKAKITDGYKIHFKKTGIDAFDTIEPINPDGNGYTRWALADSDTLILPGEGYIIIVVKS